MKKLTNLTPHSLNVAGREIPPSGQVARVSASYTEAGDVDGIPVVKQTFGTIEGLPEPASDTVYIVLGLVRAALGATRPNVTAPDTGPTALRPQSLVGRLKTLAPRPFLVSQEFNS